MTQGERARALPRGPHKLSRDEVARSQRDRLVEAMIDAVAEKGYVHATVADALARAGVSRATFYQQFRDKDDCFRAAFAAAADAIAGAMDAVLADLAADAPEPLVLLDRVLEVYLSVLAAEPAMARVFLVEVYAAGPELIRERRAVIERFADLVATIYAGRDGLLGDRPEQRFAAEALVGAVSSMVTNAVAVGESDRLPSMRAPMIDLVRQLTER